MFYAQLLVLPALLSLMLGLRWRQKLRRVRFGLPFLIFSLLLWIGAGYSIWYFHRPLPIPERRELAPGVTYLREVRSFPRQIVLHIVEFNLDQPGLGFLVTPAESIDGQPFKARTTTEFIKDFGVQVAINGGSATGFLASRGSVYSEPEKGFSILNLSSDNRVSIGRDSEGAYNAVSGKPILVEDGELADGLKNKPDPLNPETAVAVDRSGRKMWWIVVDGWQPKYSDGISTVELAELCQELGAWEAIALEGGDSSTLAIQGVDGSPEVLNSPIFGRHPPGRQRPVSSHLGAYLRK